MNDITGEQKILAIIAHLGYLLGGAGFIIAPLIIFILKKGDPFVYDHARQALISHLAVLVLSLAISFLCFLLIGILLLPVLAVVWIGLVITSVIAAIKALNGELYRYPFIQEIVDKI
ncbi:MAG TPA: DUF4870 domain-containing protein [Methylomusa anaerophila]|uniref:Chloroplast import component protein n=1 Tax=Methylomusa anaerophila TaxID=1930071 RepID=A0A348ANS3_9FIRM|nr:DUF4870 domain-containing protein [Methylomusa anaerophila]BBB92721.1 Chloroplast import component protein [Methylomusa anaerophila]HML87426.1 DUF4870 domain-containing protein [Methylomusa anaerophila]